MQASPQECERVTAPGVLQHLCYCCLPAREKLTQHSALQLAHVMQLAVQRCVIAHQLGAALVGSMVAAARTQTVYIEAVRACAHAAMQMPAAMPSGQTSSLQFDSSQAQSPDCMMSSLARLAAVLAGGSDAASESPGAADPTHPPRSGGALDGELAAGEHGALLEACVTQRSAYSAALDAAHTAQDALADRVRLCISVHVEVVAVMRAFIRSRRVSRTQSCCSARVHVGTFSEAMVVCRRWCRTRLRVRNSTGS